MRWQGHIEKMAARLEGLVHYQLPLDDVLVDVNALLGRRLRVSFMHSIRCVSCGKTIPKTYGQGFCYPCFTTVPEADACVLSPEKCRAHLGEARDMSWATAHCLIPHVVYLAMSGNIKVGVTRHTQVPIRWIDQGASSAVVLCETPNRHIAGVIEVFLKQHYPDKTKWQQMLKGVHDEGDLLVEKQRAAALLPPILRGYVSGNDQVTSLSYPYAGALPEMLAQVTFDKQSVVEGVLTAVRGQYLVFDHHWALNVRRHRGYLVVVETIDD